ncbi:hypothetical protein ACA910_009177 [Epithemia clementina (nom. ined.)]
MADRQTQPPPPLAKSRKRPRQQRRRANEEEKLQQYGVDLPEIPGLPVAVIPLHVYALKQTVASIKYDATHCVLLPSSDNDDEDNGYGNMILGENSGTIRKNHSMGQQQQEQESSSSSRLMDSLVNRVEQATASTTTIAPNNNAALSEAERVHREQEVSMRHRQRKESIQAWLVAIHRELRDTKRESATQSQRDTNSQDGGGESNGARKKIIIMTKHPQQPRKQQQPQFGIPIAALQHLWTAATDHPRVHVRRAALYMCGCLLQKSSDARRWLLEDESKRLVEWLDTIISAVEQPTHLNNSDNDNDNDANRVRQQRLWQREGYLWIQALLDSGYGTFYPRLSVVLQRLEQQCPWVTNGNNNQEDEASSSLLLWSAAAQDLETWRGWRDWALKFYRKEEQCVHRILQRCADCFDVLVPSVVEETTVNGADEAKAADTELVQDKKATKGKGNDGVLNKTKGLGETLEHADGNTNGEEEEEEDDIDWEDGWDNDEERDENDSNDPKKQSALHRQSVERTLAAIQVTTQLDHGQLVIDMTGPKNPNNQENNNAMRYYGQSLSSTTTTVEHEQKKSRARQRLRQCRTLLQERHVPRLAQWIDGLTKADGLCLVPETKALIQLPDSAMSQRKVALATCMELKSLISGTLSSIQRLHISDGGDSNVYTTMATTTPKGPSQQQHQPPNDDGGSNAAAVPANSQNGTKRAATTGHPYHFLTGASLHRRGLLVVPRPAAPGNVRVAAKRRHAPRPVIRYNNKNMDGKQSK